MFILHPVAGGNAIIPAAVPGQRVVLTIKAVGLFPVVIFHQLVGVGVLGIACVQVALAAITRFQFQRLERGEIPANYAVNVFIDNAFTTGR